LFEGWAGPISGAAGVEYRTTAAEGDSDPLSKIPGIFSQTTHIPLPKIEQEVTEGYAEFGVPLLKDLPFAKSLDFDGAVRRTRYSLSGSATTWKTGLVYQLNDEYMLRVTRSHDIRAPVAGELNPNRTTIDVSLTDPKLNTQYFVSTLNGGDPKLELENADTFTAGAVLQPSWIPGLKLSFDYYDIKVKDAIDIPTSAVAMTICRSGTDPTICTIGVDRTGTPDRVVTILTTYRNINQLNAVGKEFVANYSKDLSEISDKLSGNLNTTFNASIVNTLSTELPNGTKREFSNFTGNTGGAANTNGIPKWRGDAIITYSQTSYSLTAHVSYIPEALQNPDWIGPDQPGYSVNLPNSVNDNNVSSRTYLDLSGRMKVWGGEDHRIELFGGVNNVFDTDPPPELVYTGNGLYYSPLGRNYKVGLRANW
jgi:outer membrane receptor protein involved in Fe transport